jgi:hypothetical protein
VEPVFRFQPTKIDKSFADLLFFIGSQFGHFVGIIRRNRVSSLALHHISWMLACLISW